MIRLSLKVLLCASLFSLTASGCVPEDPAQAGGSVESAEFDRARSVADPLPGTAEEVGFLGFLNSRETTLSLLDEDLGLNRRAAEALIQRRNGRDGLYPSADDNPFASVVEVYGVRFVGPATIARIMAHVMDRGWMPGPWDVLGIYDGVPVAVVEAQAALHIANTLSEDDLDGRVGLDARAVESIAQARPLSTVEALVGLAHVGPATLSHLVRHGMDLDCGAPQDCAEGWRCLGISEEGVAQVGKCRQTTPVEGEGDACREGDVCGSGLACSDVGRPEGGMCMPSWARGRFEVSPHTLIRGTITSELVAYGLGAARVSAILHLDIEHRDHGDLRIALTAPDGAQVLVWDRGEDEPIPSSLTLFGLDDEGRANGRWTLTVSDEDGDHEGRLRAWGLEIASRL